MLSMVKDSRGVPWVVNNLSDMECVEEGIADLLALKLDHGRYRDSGGAYFSPAITVIIAVDLLCSMEIAAVREASVSCEAISVAGQDDERTGSIIDAVRLWAARDLITARDCFQSIADTYPGDAVSIFAVHMLDFYIGDQVHMLESITDSMGGFPTGDPIEGYLYGIRGFALEENGQIVAGLSSCERALALNPDDIYAMHARVHCLYELGGYLEGARYVHEFMEARNSLVPMRIHIWWHYGLFELYLGNISQVMSQCQRL